MRSLISLFFLVGCTADPASELPVDQLDQLAVGTLMLDGRSTAVPGGGVAYTVSGANAGALIGLAGSTATSGAAVCPPQLNGDCLDLVGGFRLLSTARAGSAGSASFTLNVPGAVTGSASLQAVTITPAGANTSNVLDVEFLDPAGDYDHDSLSNEDEADVYGTNWESADTDGGGLDDYVEAIVAGTDALDSSDDNGVSWACDGMSTGVQVGDCAPDFSLRNAANEFVSLSDYRGRVVFLDLSAMWCPICQTLADQTDSIVAPYAFDGVDVVTVLYEDQQGNDPSPADLNTWASAYNVEHALLRDVGRTVRNQWGGTGQPQLAIIDRDGFVTWRNSGYPGRTVVQNQIANALP